MNRTTFLIVFGILSFLLIGLHLPERAARAEQTPAKIGDQNPAIRIETSMWSWRARGRVSFALEPVIRRKLTDAGLQVVPAGEGTEALRLIVDYREERGRQVSLDIYGTEVTCRLSLEHPQRGRLLSLTMTESPGYGTLSTLPYVDVIQRLETNPYFFFLAEIVRGSISGMDAAGSLVQGLAERAAQDAGRVSSSDPEAATTLPSFEPQYQTRAMERAVEELARLNDTRARPLLVRLLSHSDWRLRLRAVLALDSLETGDVRGAGEVGGEVMVALQEVARHDRHADVREAARRMLARTESVGRP
jgi:hypothetical protein